MEEHPSQEQRDMEERVKLEALARSESTATSKPNHRAPTTPSSMAAKQQHRKKALPSSTPQEKRLKRYRTSCSRKVQERIARAKTQRLFLVEAPTATPTTVNDSTSSRECTVLGSTGNVYTVTIGPLVTCTCPDHSKGNVCKHILFVLLKVVGLPETSPLLYQAALVSQERQELFAMLDARMTRVGRRSSSGVVIMANAKVQQAYRDLMSPEKAQEPETDTTITGTPRQSTDDADCPICFDPLVSQNSNSGLLVFCRAQCGSNFHKTCMTAWKKQCVGKPTCPNCRSDWLDDSAAAVTTSGVSSPEGYTNLGRLQGQRTERDTSTYSEWMGHYHKRRRRR